MGLSKAMKLKGPQTTKPGTKMYKATLIGRTRPDGTWSGKATKGPLVIAHLPKEETRREEKAKQVSSEGVSKSA